MSSLGPRNYFNAHCHLELSHLRGAIPSGTPFVEWLKEIVRLKRESAPEFVQAGVAVALNEMQSTGTRAFLDVDSMRMSAELVRAFPTPAISFTEIIDFDPAHGDAAVQAAITYQRELGAKNPMQDFGLSPHAPYTITPALLCAARKEADARGQWLCIHASETAEEVEMFLEGNGALHQLLYAAHVLPQDWRAPGLRPIAWLAECGALGPRTLLVHLNEANGDELALVKSSGARAVVCPGTHLYFGRGEFPLKRLLDAGIPTYIGTDSLASNESLDMAREVRLAQQLAPDVEPRVIEELASARAAADFGLR